MIGKKKDSSVSGKETINKRVQRRNSRGKKSKKEQDIQSEIYIDSNGSVDIAPNKQSNAFESTDYSGNVQANIETEEANFVKYSGGDASHNDLQRAIDITKRIEEIFRQRVIGQTQLWYALMITMISNGHILIESVPGLAKTTAASTLCTAVSGKFNRIQCTPDLMPSDIIGTQIYNQGTNQFNTQLGPVHANFVLLDEINRSSAKTQSAMLEAMQERQTTIGDTTYSLPSPFMVIATQNPIEEEGTYTLPEAQMDRFILKEVITYPAPAEEVEMLTRITSGQFDDPIQGFQTTLDDVKFMQDTAKKVFVSPAIIHYITSIVNTTRGGGPNPIVGLEKLVRVPASPRASISFLKAAQALALLRNRAFVIPEDIKDLRYSVLRHRLIRTFDAMAEGVSVEAVIDQIFQVVPAP